MKARLAAVVLAVGAAGWMVATHTAAQARMPAFEPDPLWAQALPNKWVTGQVGGVAVDSHDNVWVFHRPATIPEGERGASLKPPLRQSNHPPVQPRLHFGCY